MDEEHNNDISPFWRLAETVNVVQAALLIAGIEPQGTAEYVEKWDPEKRPRNYVAARDAIVSAILKQSLDGSIAYEELNSHDRGGIPDYDYNSIDHLASSVSVPSIISWLAKRGFQTSAFGQPKTELPGFRDPSHPRYSFKLAAVVEAWEQYDPESKEGGTVKQRLMKWLRLNASRFQLTDDEGKPSENVIEELAKVANWATTGGAPRVNPSQPEPD
ncbi:MAG: hypothetical protein KDJ67_15760 [Nitratireductor sp.]|nr:hypothetical protein [Nitratireductor sp.]